MRNGAIKKGICGLLLALPLCTLADSGDADRIAGYTSQDLAAALPEKVLNMTQREVVVDAPNHALQAEYIDNLSSNKALVTLYTLPPDKNGKVAEASLDSDLDRVIASTEKEMLRQRIRPDKRDVPVDGTTRFRCLQTTLNNKVMHSLCSMLVKGRVLEIQAINMLDNVQNEAGIQAVINQQDKFVTAMGNALLSFKKP